MQSEQKKNADDALMNEAYRRKYVELTSDPELDPTSPQFNRGKYDAAIEKQCIEIQEHFKMVSAALIGYVKMKITEAASFELPEQQTAKLQDLRDFLEKAFNKNVLDSEKADAMLQIVQHYRAYLESVNEQTPESAEDLPQITVKGKGAEKTIYPIDKLNAAANIWHLLANADAGGQIAFTAEKHGSKQTATILYSINFDDLEESGLNVAKKITVFDKRVQIAANALFKSSGELMTIAQIYASMGYEGRPGKSDIKRIYTSLEKMRLIPISIDNSSVNKLYPNIEKFVYNGVMLPWESVDAIVNGQRAEGVIHLFRQPPLISFAETQKQITTIPRALLVSPVNKTDVHLRIDDYLITHISRLKNSKGKVSNKLLFSTIYKKADVSTRLQKNRAKEAITKYLDHYKDCGFIKGYKTATDGVSILD